MKKLENARTWDCLKRGILKKEIEGLLTAAQDQAFWTKYIRNMIDKQDVSPMCRLCGEREGNCQPYRNSMQEISSKAIYELEVRSVDKGFHWELCQNYDLQSNDTWYDHSPDAVMEDDQLKLLWDFRI